MARAYSVAMVAHALGLPHKWVDNVLSHNQLPGVLRVERGVRRQLSWNAVLILALTESLSRNFFIPIPGALALAQRLLESDEARVEQADLILRVDREALERRTDALLRDAAGEAITPKRGRPPEDVHHGPD